MYTNYSILTMTLAVVELKNACTCKLLKISNKSFPAIYSLAGTIVI
eukprot:XP_001706799.1 Hypothetical protein GL50803_4638 [Giardia lamblia ATCC 50803]